MLDRSFRRFLVAALSFPLASALVASARPASAQVEPTTVVADNEQPPPAKGTEATEPSETSDRSARSESYWYGWQTASADGASLAVIGLGAATGASVVSAVGVGGVVGLGSAMVVDAAALSYGRRELAAPRESGALRVTSVAPSYDPLTRTASVGMGGRF